MTGDESESDLGPLESVFEGGLPQILAGSAGKAISRLIGAGADIPAAWLEAFAQDIRDKTSARSKVTDALATEAAKIAVENPEILERATNSMLSRAMRTQENREAVAKVAVEELKNDPPPADGPGPSDDWMLKFERQAEEATADDLRMMFGRLLAGEIRAPGGVAPSTLHFVSMLEEETALLIQRTLPYASKNAVYLDAIEPPLSVEEQTHLEQSGYFSTGKNYTIIGDEHGVVASIIREDKAFRFESEPNKKFVFPVGILSRAGRDLVKVSDVSLDIQKIGNLYFSSGVRNFVYGAFTMRDGLITIENGIKLEPPEAGISS